MRFRLAPILALWLPLLAGAGSNAEEISLGGATRHYELFRPQKLVAAREGMPLMVVLHETGGTAARIRRSLGMDTVAEREGFAVAYPEAQGGAWNDGRNQLGVGRERAGGDDVAFLRALVQQLAAQGLGTPGDAAAVGVDGGGMMVYRLACETSGVFSSYSGLLANMPSDLRQRCQPSARVPMLILAGTEDTFMPFAGGRLPTTPGIVQSGDATFQFWGGVNGCGAGEVVDLPDLDQGDGSRVEVLAGVGCANNADTVYYRVVGGGHQLPTRPASARSVDRGSGKVNHDVDTRDLIWMFVAGRR